MDDSIMACWRCIAARDIWSVDPHTCPVLALLYHHLRVPFLGVQLIVVTLACLLPVLTSAQWASLARCMRWGGIRPVAVRLPLLRPLGEHWRPQPGSHIGLLTATRATGRWCRRRSLAVPNTPRRTSPLCSTVLFTRRSLSSATCGSLTILEMAMRGAPG